MTKEEFEQLGILKGEKIEIITRFNTKCYAGIFSHITTDDLFWLTMTGNQGKGLNEIVTVKKIDE